MKIGLVCPYDYSFPGGVAIHVSYLARYFLSMGHQVKVIAPCSKNNIPHFGEDVIKVGRPFSMPRNGALARISLSPWIPAQAKKILAEERFDIVHIHEPFVPLLSLTTLLESNSVNIGTFHAHLGKTRAYQLGQPIFRRWIGKLHGKIAVSRVARDCVSRYFPGDFQIIPNGVDLDLFSPQVSPREEFADGKVNILSVSRFEPRKGLCYLLNAYGEVKRRIPDARLIIVAPKTRASYKYKEIVERNKLSDVIFVSSVSSSELPSYYSSADIFCSPAIGGESFGIVLLEAMASGKPVVASNIEGYNDVLNHGEEGLLVSPKDEEALAQALLSLTKDKSLRQQMGAKGRIKAKEYSWKYIAQKIIDYYATLLNNPDKFR